MTAAQRKFSGPVGCDIWTIRLDRLDAARLKALSHVLSPLEHTQVARLRREHDRLRALASRGVLRYLLSAYSGVPAERLSIDRACPRCGDPHGRPLMRDGEWTASVTHSADTLAVAVARGRPIGLDLEHTDTDQHPANLVELILTPTERQDYASSPRTGLPLLLSYWTHKEAVLKCTGKGLQIGRAHV